MMTSNQRHRINRTVLAWRGANTTLKSELWLVPFTLVPWMLAGVFFWLWQSTHTAYWIDLFALVLLVQCMIMLRIARRAQQREREVKQ